MDRRDQSKRTGKGTRRTAKAASSATARKSPRKWSGAVTRESDALDLEPGVFKKSSPAAIARSLKRSADASARRKTSSYQSAMSMLNFYINRAGRNLSEKRLDVLERAKAELRKAFGRD